MLTLILDLILGPHVEERCILSLQPSHAQHRACLGEENIIVSLPQSPQSCVQSGFRIKILFCWPIKS